MIALDEIMLAIRFIVRPIIVFLVVCSADAQEKRPNIVFILADDLDVEVFNHQETINSLITANGTQFRNHFVSVSICCPSRATTLRGQFSHNTGVFTNSGSDGGFRKFSEDGLEKSTIATWLQASGYRTALVGKYLNGYGVSGKEYIPPGWTEWYSPNGGKPYGGYDYSMNENGVTIAYGHAAEDFATDVISRKAGEFIKRSVEQFPGQPFFLYVAPFAPHSPATPAPRYRRLFSAVIAPRSVSFNEGTVSDKPAWLNSKPLLTAEDIKQIDSLYRRQWKSMLAVGDLVRNVIETLEATGQIDSTYVFFTSDNGFHRGQHRLLSGKNTAFEEDIHVPLVVRGPGVPARQIVDHMTANVDYAPTFAEIAGVKPPEFVDGRSLVPFLAGVRPPVWRQALLLEHHQGVTLPSANGLLEPQDPYDEQAAASAGAPNFAGLRTASRLTYVEYDTGERELYNLALDPDQINNVYVTADPVLKTRFSNWLGALRYAAGQRLRDAEQFFP